MPILRVLRTRPKRAALPTSSSASFFFGGMADGALLAAGWLRVLWRWRCEVEEPPPFDRCQENSRNWREVRHLS